MRFGMGNNEKSVLGYRSGKAVRPSRSLSKNPKLAADARKQRFAARPACLRPNPALRLRLATRFMAFSHFWR